MTVKGCGLSVRGTNDLWPLMVYTGEVADGYALGMLCANLLRADSGITQVHPETELTAFAAAPIGRGKSMYGCNSVAILTSTVLCAALSVVSVQ